jgi:hypothetical protein
VRLAPKEEALDLELVVAVKSLVLLGAMIRKGANEQAFEHVKQLIMRSRTLADVNGKRSAEKQLPRQQLRKADIEKLREQMVTFLGEQGDWVKTAAVRKQFTQLSQSAILNALRRLEAEGRIESRSFGHGSAIEWRTR